jgi:hypothetical protein
VPRLDPSTSTPTDEARSAGGLRERDEVSYRRLESCATSAAATTATIPTTIKLATHEATPRTAAMPAARPATAIVETVALVTARLARRAGRGIVANSIAGLGTPRECPRWIRATAALEDEAQPTAPDYRR